jgi:drug/metabolite transporter (DMT)-like permease
MISIRMLVVGMILFGSLNTIVRKAQMVTCVRTSFPDSGPGVDACTVPKEEPFNKPWMSNLFMFLGEVLLISITLRKAGPETDSDPSSGAPTVPFHYFALPASLDVIGSGLSGVGMIFISASVWQMLRGSLILYTAGLSYFWLKREFRKEHYWGLAFAATGLTFVGVSSWLDSQDDSLLSTQSSSDAVFGIVLTVLSQFCTALQIVFEESLLKSFGYSRPSPAQVVAYEGILGSIMMVVVLVGMQLAPGDDHGSFENSIDSVEKMSRSELLQFLIILYLISIALFNYFGMTIAKHLSSVHRTLIDSSRSTVVWAFQLVMWYVFGSEVYGSKWTSNSFLQFFGFLLIIFGTLVYNEVGTQRGDPSSAHQPLVVEMDTIDGER